MFYSVRASAYSSLSSAIQSGVNINHQDQMGDTALHWAVRRRDQVAVRILLDAGADVGISNNVSRKKKRESTRLLTSVRKTINNFFHFCVFVFLCV